jgi:1-acyl-sn-glycerol-3-phosphate acyltransferase
MSAPARAAVWLRWLGRAALLLALMTFGAAAMLAAGVFTEFRAGRFYTGVLARGLSRAFLRACGVRLAVHGGPFPQTQTVYVANHSSSMDVFILLVLGLPNTRFFLKGYLRAVLPLAVMGYLMGTFWTYPQTMPRRRVRLFQAAERTLRRTGESVFLSPEGRVTTGSTIAPFNKGAFHLATSLGAPIVPLYLAVPASVDPGRAEFIPDVRPAVVHVYVQPPIPTHDWKLADLDDNRRRVREVFLDLHERLKAR